MEKPSPSFSSETVAVVSSFCAVIPAPPSCAESAMVNSRHVRRREALPVGANATFSKREWTRIGRLFSTAAVGGEGPFA